MPPLTGEVPLKGVEGFASPWREKGIVKSEEVRWPQSGRIKICRHRRHHTYSLFTITSYFDYPSVSFADSSPDKGSLYIPPDKNTQYE